MALLMLSVMPLVLAEGDDDGGDVDIIIVGQEPEIYTDHTQRSWNPNDQTFYTAEIYGTPGTNCYGQDYYDVPIRGDYVFTGETIDYYVIVEDLDGDDNIDTVILQKDGSAGPSGVGSCSKIDIPSPWPITDNNCDGYPNWNSYAEAKFGIDSWNDDTMNLYRCQLVVQSAWNGDKDFNVKATDDDGNFVETPWMDTLAVNPPLSVDLVGSISFGSAEAGTTVTSNTVGLDNVGSDGVVMDMYVASDDYFTDPSNPLAICGNGNGIPYDAFSYYATKGSMDSGDNDNNWPGLGSYDGCYVDADEYTEMPSHSGDTDDMCRIINHKEHGSFLTQGQSMSLTFQLDVPMPCSGSFTSGSFHFRGRVV